MPCTDWIEFTGCQIFGYSALSTSDLARLPFEEVGKLESLCHPEHTGDIVLVCGDRSHAHGEHKVLRGHKLRLGLDSCSCSCYLDVSLCPAIYRFGLELRSLMLILLSRSLAFWTSVVSILDHRYFKAYGHARGAVLPTQTNTRFYPDSSSSRSMGK